MFSCVLFYGRWELPVLTVCRLTSPQNASGGPAARLEERE
jgi:hypothetical protein